VEPVTGSTFWEMLEHRVIATPHGLALADEHRRRVTWTELKDWSERVAAGLTDVGIGPDDVVSWQLPTRVETIVVSLALSRLGVVQNPIIHLYRAREVASLLRNTGATWFIQPGTWRGFDYESMAETIRAETTDTEARQSFTILNGYDNLPQGDPARLPAAPSDGHAVTWLYSTSGTTSEPKIVLHSDSTLIAGGVGVTEALQPQPTDINATPFPFAHIGGPDNLVMSLRSGMANALVEAFSPAESLEFFAELEATYLGGSTAHYLALLAEEARLGRNPVPTLHTMCGGGAPKPPEVFWRVKERSGVTIQHGYGMTECPMITCGAVGDTDEQLANSDGGPVVGCEIMVVDAAESPVEADVDGDILVRGPMLARGYLDPSQTAASFRPDGYFRTGDRGYLRPDGHIAITGRSTELIIRKGENISPREVEDVLMTHASVAAVAVLGLTDQARGERVCAVIETAAGANELSFDAMVQHCRDAGLMTQKIPEQLEIVTELPRNPTMKILKRVLVERLSKGNAS
jgi:cyclohexanecarboxylate-CoA ligase